MSGPRRLLAYAIVALAVALIVGSLTACDYATGPQPKPCVRDTSYWAPLKNSDGIVVDSLHVSMRIEWCRR